MTFASQNDNFFFLVVAITNARLSSFLLAVTQTFFLQLRQLPDPRFKSLDFAIQRRNRRRRKGDKAIVSMSVVKKKVLRQSRVKVTRIDCGIVTLWMK